MQKLLRGLAFPAFAAVAVAACDSGGTFVDDVRPGTFEGRVTGDVSANVDGRAASGSSVDGYHDLILLTDFDTGAEITLYHVTDEFRAGRFTLGDFDTGEIIADLYFPSSGRYFTSFSGSIDLEDVSRSGIDGTARFRAQEVDDFGDPIFGSEVVVDVAFRTDYDPLFTFSRSPMTATVAPARSKAGR